MNDTTAVIDAPGVQEDETSGTGADRRKLFIVGGVVLALIIAAGAFFLLSGSSEEADTGLVPSARKPAAAAPDNSAAAPADAATGTTTATEPIGEYTDDLGRDPLGLLPLPLKDDGTGASAEAATEPTTGGEVTTDTGGGTVTTDTSTAGTVVNLTLSDVTAVSADFVIDGTPVTAKTDGTPFNGTFRIYGVFSDRCAGVMNGDNSFVICEGDTRNVTA